jgi:hypothetical protein
MAKQIYCTRCGFKLPFLPYSVPLDEAPVFQSIDGHNAVVHLSGGYDEFVDTYDRPMEVANLCKPCGQELVKWLNADMDAAWEKYYKEQAERYNNLEEKENK